MNTPINKHLNSQLTTPSQARDHNTDRTDTVLDEARNNLRTSWPVIRAILVVWAVAVWLLLVLMPGIEQITDAATAMLHLPNMLIGLALVGAMFAAYNLRSDGHMLWFLGVLLLLAGWM